MFIGIGKIEVIREIMKSCYYGMMVIEVNWRGL